MKDIFESTKELCNELIKKRNKVHKKIGKCPKEYKGNNWEAWYNGSIDLDIKELLGRQAVFMAWREMLLNGIRVKTDKCISCKMNYRYIWGEQEKIDSSLKLIKECLK